MEAYNVLKQQGSRRHSRANKGAQPIRHKAKVLDGRKQMTKQLSRLSWDAKVGPASIVGLVQLVAMIAGLGAMYGALSGKLDAAATNAIEAKTAVASTAKEITKEQGHRDEKIASQGERIGKIETSVGFIVPAIQRIEAKIDANKP